MDIDDILASVHRDNFTSPESTALDHQQLTRLWIAERAVSELLPWPEALMERMMERVRTQVETIEDLTASSYDAASSSGTGQNQNHNQTVNLKLSILQTDLSRTQFLIRSFLRQRIAKLTKYAMHYLLLISPPGSSASQQASSSSNNNNSTRTEDTIPNPTTSATTSTSPLSPEEAKFLYSHQHLLATHYSDSFLASFPPQLRRLDDNAGGTSMVQGPDSKEVCFVRVLVDEVTVVVPADDTLNEDTFGTTMRIGEVWVARWEGVRRAWERGEVEVL
ncbi:uncharacterized protein TRUGW13939_06467 [Talaromyces rugulosus]|uniref:DNA replication complex GINS protein SLD5 n=1 Tax=Talaromyces rugulosus TaxID=121627 RepID=A0A7H8R3B0_TALRU|nr:uncharacterized protein TRUGW13939_06467 [Talaromyces rugulosus]QKX59333.1 hypothetical protein TRUGW13939_06467 [Talaromyces rugulosus]